MALFVGSWPLWHTVGCLAYSIKNFFPLAFHLWCMLGGSIWIWIKSNLFWFIEDQTQFSTYWHAKLNLTLNEPLFNVLCPNHHTTSKHAPLTHLPWKVLLYEINQLPTKSHVELEISLLARQLVTEPCRYMSWRNNKSKILNKPEHRVWQLLCSEALFQDRGWCYDCLPLFEHETCPTASNVHTTPATEACHHVPLPLFYWFVLVHRPSSLHLPVNSWSPHIHCHHHNLRRRTYLDCLRQQ